MKKAVSGFVEWQPKVKQIEEKWLQRISRRWRRNGFLPIETAAVEYLSTLEIKGEIDKEIYCLTKLGSDVSKELALHYDLTIPLARFVTEHFAQLAFPFKRYQIQKVWRGERPQFGRYREFYQADIDIIDSENLAPFYDAQVLSLGVSAMLGMKIAPFRVGVSNRKIYEGYLQGLGIANTVPILRIIDKLDKLGAEGVAKVLTESAGLDSAQVEKCLALAQFSLKENSPLEALQKFGHGNELFRQGILELEQLLKDVDAISSRQVQNAIYPDFSFVRGFDYYTGSIFEGKFDDQSGYGSICSGGRYDNLAEGFGNKKLPGVGFSIGITRILAKESQNAETLLDYPKSMANFCLILEGGSDGAERLLRAGKELQRNRHSVNTISVGKLKKGLQIASRTEARVAMFLFDGKLMFKQMSTGQQIEIPEGPQLVAQATEFLNSALPKMFERE